NGSHTALPLIRAELYYYWRRYDDSLNLVRAVQKVDPRNTTAFGLVTRDEIALGHPAEALAAAREAVRLEPGEYKASLAAALHAAGLARESERVARQMTAEAQPGDYYTVALTFANLADREEAMRWLERALQERVADLPSMRWDPALDSLRGEPRYRAIVAAIYGSG
ncbi:MAG TPA: hypothetical protein VGS58_11690, partial [Candidatus Sulfopaludibacter sp.]|nr:hypothetical protein [Candidatus Sulfopaludibacter sp.]